MSLWTACHFHSSQFNNLLVVFISPVNDKKLFMTIKLQSTAGLPLFLSALLTSPIYAEEKHHEDPTKIVTKAGIGYADDAWKVSGSVGLDAARMINGRINTDGDEWRIGGSWLLPLGIVNFNFSRNDYDEGAYRNNYSIGTFVPLSYFDIEPMGIQLFPMAGYSYNDGEFYESQPDSSEDLLESYVLTPKTSHGVYLGMFGLRPLTDKWSMMGFGGANRGSDDYSGYWVGGGFSYKINTSQSFNTYGVYSDDDFGKRDFIGFSYTYEFK